MDTLAPTNMLGWSNVMSQPNAWAAVKTLVPWTRSRHERVHIAQVALTMAPQLLYRNGEKVTLYSFLSN